MFTNYQLDKIKLLLNDFTKITGLRIGLFDVDFNEIFITVDHCEFCNMMRNDPIGFCRCLESDYSAIEKAKEMRGVNIYRCHAGLIEACAPIYDDNELLGYIFLGQMLGEENYEEQCANIELLVSDIIDDSASIRNKLKNTKRLNKDYLVSATNVMVACTRFIIYEQLLKYEKSDIWYKVNEYIKSNYDKKITLEGMSEMLSVSVPTLCKITKQKSGKTIVEIITETRIEKAKYYLENSKLSIAEISSKLGIDDYSYFSRIFKKSTGFSPNVWRKNYCQNKKMGI